MAIRSYLEHLMGMTDAVWDRHANPWSGWSRISIPVLFALAVWSRVWIGWMAVIPVGIVLIWTWWNPRAFPVPKSHDNWMTKGVLGERVWLDRHKTPIPLYHSKAATYLAIISGLGLPPFAWGLWALDIWAVVTALTLIMIGKLWFLDRMGWLLQETEHSIDPSLATNLCLDADKLQATNATR